ncbi:galactosyltransferase-related protein [Shewanella sp. UCD-KL12]|uniref:galactosyltransferase-related protein n=1 Tax=Shewanella sp. UCD-KL12 TaxID=1917163 RepID=UPI001C4BB554|nr:galactosyltransferase-related protein [Shewanella sp. UCD-KL12]
MHTAYPPPILAFIVPYTQRPYLAGDNRLTELVDILLRVDNCEVVLHITGELPRESVALINLLSVEAAGKLTVLNKQMCSSTPYSPGQARNEAVGSAKGKYLFFMDVDLIACPKLLATIVDRAERLTSIGEQAFEMFPCLYLSQQKSAELQVQLQELAQSQAKVVLAADMSANFKSYLESFMQGSNCSTDGIALASSCLLVNKAWFKKLGGFDACFIGHGGEDLEFVHRLCMHYSIGKLPEDYTANIKSQHPAHYQGFRRYFSLYAVQHLFEERYFVHLWHPRPLASYYHRRRNSNDHLLEVKLKSSVEQVRLESSHSPAIKSACGVDERTVLVLKTQFHKWLEETQTRYGFDRKSYPGLFHWAEGVTVKRTRSRKFRKLLLKPRLFFTDLFMKHL